MDAMARPRPETDPTIVRTPIWVEGRQRPRFDLRAWARVGFAMALRLAPLWLDRSAAASGQFGQAIAAGRFGMGWTGRAGRWLPSRALVSGVILGLAARQAEARLILAPAPEAPEVIAYPDLIRTAPEPVTNLPPAASLTPEEVALRAIRAVLRDLPPVEPTRARPGPLPELAAREPQTAPQSASLLARLGARMIAWAAVALALPAGLVRAALIHLDGGDLKDWD